MTLAALKRKLAVGTKLTMVRHDWYPTGKLIGVPRYVISTNTQGIELATQPDDTTGSHLHWKGARNISITETGFTVALDSDKGLTGPTMEYVYN